MTVTVLPQSLSVIRTLLPSLGSSLARIRAKVNAAAVNGLADLGASGDVPATVWITEDGDHALIRAKLDPSEGNSVQMTLSDWGKTVTVTKPAA